MIEEKSDNMTDDRINDDLSEESDVRGAIVCDYNTFKTIYRLNARAAVREDKRVIVATIKIVINRNEEETKEVFNRIGAALANSLRRDDVVTGFDTTQYLLLLSNLTINDAENVLFRLINKLKEELGDDIMIETRLQTLEPVVTAELSGS